jgi:hypothetical protein
MNAHVVFPRLLIGEEDKFYSRIVSPIGTGKLHSFGFHGTFSSDVDRETVRIELRTTPIGWIRCALNGVSMKSEELSAKNIHPSLDVARNLKIISPMVLEELFICPELYPSKLELANKGFGAVSHFYFYQSRHR